MYRYLLLTLLIALPASAEERPSGVAGRGYDLAVEHCTRCHVVPGVNPMGGISSTPSFDLLVTLGDWKERFGSFYVRRPHPVFVRVPGTPPPSDIPSHTAEIEMSLDEVDALVAYAEALAQRPD